MEDKNKKPVDTQQLKKPTGKSVTGKPLDGIEIRPQLKGLGNRQHNEDTVVLTDTLAEKKALTLVQRQRRARILRAKEPKMQRAKEVAQHKLASDQKLKARAVVKARNIVKMRFAARKGTPYTELTTSEKIQVDKVVDKKVGLIRKLATRLLPSLRKAEVNRLASFQAGAKLQHATAGPVNEEFNNIVESLDNKTSIQLVGIISDSINALNENNDSMGITLKRLLNAVLPEDAAISTLVHKAERNGIPFSIIKEVFERGSFAWEEDGRTTQEQFAFARVNSYIAKGKAWTLDADLREEKLINNKLDNVFEAYHTGLSTSTAKKREAHWKKMEKYSDKDDRAYQDAPGDKEARKKPMPQSVHTKKYHAMYGEEVNESTDPDYHAKVHQDLQWHAGRNRGRSMGAANYHHLMTKDDQSHIEKHYEKTILPILKKHRYPTPPEGPGDSGNQKYHAAVKEIIKNWEKEPRINESTSISKGKGTYHGADKDLREAGPGLWANIHAKRKRIKAGSGERMRKPGEKGAPSAAGLKSASEAVEDAVGNKIADTARHGKVRYAGVRTADHKETSTQERQEVQYMKRHRIHTKRETDADPQQIRIAQDQIKKKVIDESNNKSNEDTPAKREFGTKSLVKKYQKETPGQEKADINEIFNTAFDEEVERRGDFKLIKVRTPKGYVWRKVRKEVDIERDAE